jgi:RNA polymerase sigma factor (sigma-70 family)
VPRILITPELLAAAKAGDRGAADQVVRGMEGAAKAVALWFTRHYQDASIDLDDLIQEGLISVTRTIRRYDPSLGIAKFETYAYTGIRNACAKWAGRERQRSAVELRETDFMAEAAGKAGQGHDRAGDTVRGEGRAAGLKGFEAPASDDDAAPSLRPVAGLSGDGAEVVAMRLEPILAGQDPLPWRTIARRLGISLERVRELYAATLELIREGNADGDEEID